MIYTQYSEKDFPFLMCITHNQQIKTGNNLVSPTIINNTKFKTEQT